MRIRDLRAGDAPRVLEMLLTQFPEEEAILGTRPEGFARVIDRVFRWDSRLVLAVLRGFGRPVFRFFVAEETGTVAGTTLLTFTGRAGYVSMVVVDPAYRRRGLARALLEEARRATRARGQPYLALDVLDANHPARALYESIGYRPLRSAAFLVHDRPSTISPDPAALHGIRPFVREDARALAEVVRRDRPREVEEVLPTTPREIAGSAWASRLLESEQAAWVVDPGTGPVAWVGASVPRATEAGNLQAPIVASSVAPEVARALVEVAGAWCAARRVPRIAVSVTAENLRGRAAVDAAGFRHALSLWTLYRPTA